jgi:hypothetical protein
VRITRSLATACTLLIAGFFLLSDETDVPRREIIIIDTPKALLTQPPPPRPVPTAAPLTSDARSPQLVPYSDDRALRSPGVLLVKNDFAAESIDAPWAEPSEMAIRQTLLSIPYVDTTATRVICRSTICRATGRMKADLSQYNYGTAENLILDNLSFDNLLVDRSSYNREDNSGEFSIELSRVHK